jgi:xylan 1,4-beta-xylosidase
MKLTHYRIDREHSNSYAAWLDLGSPIAPNDAQRALLLSASQLASLGAAQNVPVSNGTARLEFELPRQGVSLLLLEAH